tara:strand:+ start:356 stop:979 length:624 start_codon:yes stop_codon:yes gene_type:complete
MTKNKFTWRDLSLGDFKVYLFSLFKALIPKKKIKSFDELEEFVQTRSAWVSQVTLYNYLKTRMGTRYVLHFDNDEFMASVNQAKWNIYAVALQDLTFYSFSFLKVHFNFEDIGKSKEIFLKILDDETANKMPSDIIKNAKENFEKRSLSMNWDEYHTNLPFNASALSLYEWAPIADELKTLDRKIILNSVILKWDVIKKEFKERIQF